MSGDRVAIVGIGASAGGVQALRALLRAMPDAPGLGIVVLCHHSADQPSILAEILARESKLPVTLAQHGQAVEADHVYVCPPGRTVTIEGGAIRLQDRNPAVPDRQIDALFLSLAADLEERAVGVLLSGSGSDGTLGIKAIKEAGGLTVAQTGDGAGPQYRSMPDTAIALGVVDLAIPVEEIPARLIEYRHSLDAEPDLAAAAPPQAYEPEQKAQDAIYAVLLNQVGHDFSGYKRASFLRRVRRRMQVLRIDTVADYVEHLKQNASEVTLLFRDLLIGVTSFFRDAESFEALANTVIARLVAEKQAADSIRVWVPGCATGEEVYSLAILLAEAMQAQGRHPKVQIFATDIDENALLIARTGRYPAKLLDKVAPQRLERYFVAEGDSYLVSKDLREMCVFSSHNLVRDPPFSRLDIISCRNLLIYFGAEFQANVMPIFHFALRPGGFLFLGISENVTQYADLFTPVDKRYRIFQRRDHVHVPLPFPRLAPGRRVLPSAPEGWRNPAETGFDLRHAVDARIMERFAPAHVVVNAEGEVLHYSARTGKYLEHAAGMPNRQLVLHARRGLGLELRAALREVADMRQPILRERLHVELDDRVQVINLLVEPLTQNENDPLFLVVFEDVGAPVAAADLAAHGAGDDRTVVQLEQEMRETRERLQSTVEEYETAVEELKASNEELQSMNEELQSTNEEMETSKEELQSVNEELNTVNVELSSKVEELDRAHNDLHNIFASTRIATIFLDCDLVIRSFTPAVSGIFNLISTDRGRPLTDIASNIEHDDLRRDVLGVIERDEAIERNVRSKDGKTHYLVRVLPYHGRNKRVEGALVTFVDVTRIIVAEAHQRLLVEELNHRVRNMLTIVSAISTQTLASHKSPEAFAEAFTGRIRAMGTAYALVSRENWGDVSLEEAITAQVRPHNTETGQRITVEGPPVICRPSAALAIGLIMHEMATNAIKYGALSNARGRVGVTWPVVRQDSSPALRLIWSEQGGPPPKRSIRKGFGSNFIERELKGTLGAAVDLQFAPGGLQAVIIIPGDPKRIVLPPEHGGSDAGPR